MYSTVFKIDLKQQRVIEAFGIEQLPECAGLTIKDNDLYLLGDFESDALPEPVIHILPIPGSVKSQAMTKSIFAYRLLIIAGLTVGLISLNFTFSQIGDSSYLVGQTDDTAAPLSRAEAEHIWYHVYREGIGDIASIFALLILAFLPHGQRSKTAWSIMLVLWLGYYSPFWTSLLISPGMRAPNMGAEIECAHGKFYSGRHTTGAAPLPL